MKLFIAKIVYKIVNNKLRAQEQFDEQLFFVNAQDHKEAFFKARMLGVKNEDEVSNENGNLFWKFIDVPFIKEVSLSADEFEIHSTILEREVEDNYENFIKLRAQELQVSIDKGIIPVLV